MINHTRALNQFLKSVQNRAFVTAKFSTANEDDALDVVQDSMFKLAQKYAHKPEDEWPALFQRILQNRLKDYYRSQKMKKLFYFWQQHENTESKQVFDIASLSPSPAQHHASQQQKTALNGALKKLPQRQQEAFVLRALWEYSTAETANIMHCTEGSVKTHYSRANAALQKHLQENEDEKR
ncbi:MAG: RNA polymerase sigma factor [Pseudomonadales bacterium]|nr:RNA polymerase sigma factor [Pseudomonadales bacterium]